MKVFYVFAILFLYVLNVNALLKKRMDEDQLWEQITEYLRISKIDDPVPVYWKITHYGITEEEVIPGTTDKVDVGHHWIVAEPLTEKGGVFDNSAYVKLHLSFDPIADNSPIGTIKTKITISKSSFTEQGANIIESGETKETVNIIDMVENLGTVENESFKDGANYYKYSSSHNCQGFSACQFEKVYEKYLNQVGGCSD